MGGRCTLNVRADNVCIVAPLVKSADSKELDSGRSTERPAHCERADAL